MRPLDHVRRGDVQPSGRADAPEVVAAVRPRAPALESSRSDHAGKEEWRSVVSRADVSQHGPELSPAAAAELRVGPAGVVRPDLIDAHIARVLNAQLEHHPLAAIKEFVWRNPERREVAEIAYAAVTQFGSLERLVGLAHRLDHICAESNRALYCPNDTSLGAVVRYLGVNKGVLPLDWKIRATNEIDHDTVVVLDEVVIDRLRREPAFRRAIVDRAVTLVCPLGWYKGVTPFSTPELCEVETRVNGVIARSTIEPNADHAAIRRAFDATLARDVVSVLRRLDRRLVEQVEFVAGAEPEGGSNLERITEQLNGRSGVSPDTLVARINQFDSALRPAVRELLARHASLFSHHSLARAARDHAAVIDALAAERDVSPQNVVFCCPAGGKSFGMYGLIFRQANPQYSSDMFIRLDELGAWVSERSQARRLVIMLDDLAVTGETYKKAVPPILLEAPRLEAHEVVISPLVATQLALQTLDAAATTSGCLVRPARVERRLIDGELYGGASEADRVVLRAALGSLGFHESGVMLALPYMAPDNNVELFATCFAEFFTLHEGAVRGRGEGYKRFVERRRGDAATLLERETHARLKDARSIAMMAPSLESLNKTLYETRLFWEHLPSSVQGIAADDWSKTVRRFEREGDQAVFAQLRHLGRVVAEHGVEPGVWFKSRIEYEVLAKLAAQMKLSAASRTAIQDFAAVFKQT